MRLALVFLCFAVVLGFAADECANCAAFAGRPHAAIMTSVDEVSQTLSAYVFYENTTASPPRQPVNDSIIVIEISNSSFREIYKMYTGPMGNITFNFSSWAQVGCINIKVLYCPFCSPDSEAPCFLQCIQYAGLSNNKTDYLRPNNSYQFSSTERTARPQIVNVSDIEIVPHTSAPTTPNPDKYFPDLQTVSYCAPPPPMNATPAMCFPLLIIFSLLGGALYITGKNPFMSFNIGSQHVGRHIRYQARGRGVSISGQAIVGAVSTIKKAAKDSKSPGGLKGAEKAAAAGRNPISQMKSAIGGIRGIGTMVRSMREGFKGPAVGKDGKRLTGVAAFNAKMGNFNATFAARMGKGGGVSSGAATQIATGKGVQTMFSGSGGGGLRAADIAGHIKAEGGNVFAQLGSYYKGVGLAVVKAGFACVIYSQAAQMVFSFMKTETVQKIMSSLNNNDARIAEDLTALKAFREKVTINGKDAVVTSSPDGKQITFTALKSGDYLETGGTGIDKLGVTKITITLDESGKIVSSTSTVVASRDFGAFTKGDIIGTIVSVRGGEPELKMSANAMMLGEKEIGKIGLGDFKIDPVKSGGISQSVMGSYVGDNIAVMEGSIKSIQQATAVEIARKDSALNSEIKRDPELQSKIIDQMNTASVAALALASITPPGGDIQVPEPKWMQPVPGQNIEVLETGGGGSAAAPKVQQTEALATLSKIATAMDQTELRSAETMASAISGILVPDRILPKGTTESSREASLAPNLTEAERNAVNRALIDMLANREAILPGSAPGSSMTMKELAEYLKTNPAPIMEALTVGLHSVTSDEQRIAAVIGGVKEKHIDNAAGVLSDQLTLLDRKLTEQGMPPNIAHQIGELDVGKATTLYGAGYGVNEAMSNPAAMLAQNAEALDIKGKVGDLLQERTMLSNEAWHARNMEQSLAQASGGNITGIVSDIDSVNRSFGNYLDTKIVHAAQGEKEFKESPAAANFQEATRLAAHEAMIEMNTSLPSLTAQYAEKQFTAERETAIQTENAFRKAAEECVEKRDFGALAEAAQSMADLYRHDNNHYAAGKYEELAEAATRAGQLASGANANVVMDGSNGTTVGQVATEMMREKVSITSDPETFLRTGAMSQHEAEQQEKLRTALSLDNPAAANLNQAGAIAAEQMGFFRNSGDEQSAAYWENGLALINNLKRGLGPDGKELPPLNSEEGKATYAAVLGELHESVGMTFDPGTLKSAQERLPDLEGQHRVALDMAASEIAATLGDKSRPFSSAKYSDVSAPGVQPGESKRTKKPKAQEPGVFDETG